VLIGPNGNRYGGGPLGSSGGTVSPGETRRLGASNGPNAPTGRYLATVRVLSARGSVLESDSVERHVSSFETFDATADMSEPAYDQLEATSTSSTTSGDGVGESDGFSEPVGGPGAGHSTREERQAIQEQEQANIPEEMRTDPIPDATTVSDQEAPGGGSSSSGLNRRQKILAGLAAAGAAGVALLGGR